MRKKDDMRYKKQYVEKFPIIQNYHKSSAVAGLAANIQNRKMGASKEETSSLERKIDEEVYRLYDLTPDEIAIIESATSNAQKKAI